MTPEPRVWRAADSGQERLTAVYAAWAARVGFVEHGFDGRYRGTLDDVDVIIDNGARASGCYPVEVRLGLSLDEPAGTIRTRDRASTLLRERLIAAMKLAPPIDSIRIERDVVVVTTKGRLDPERAEAIARSIAAVCRPCVEPVGPYR